MHKEYFGECKRWVKVMGSFISVKAFLYNRQNKLLLYRDLSITVHDLRQRLTSMARPRADMVWYAMDGRNLKRMTSIVVNCDIECRELSR